MTAKDETDIFEDVLQIEARLRDRGVTEGSRAGESRGFQDGFSMGWSNGFEFAQEVSYMWSFAVYVKSQDQIESARLAKSVQKLELVLVELKEIDLHDETMQTKLETARAAFKLVLAQSGFPVQSAFGDPTTSFTF